MSQKVAILGCGFLGTALAIQLREKKFFVTATTRKSEKLSYLSGLVQKGVVWRGADEEGLASLVQENDILILMLGADRADLYEETYEKVALTLRHVALGLNSPKHLIYTSSTAVYGDHQGRFVDENSPLLNTAKEGKVLQETESTLHSLSHIGWSITLLRCSELYGPPGRTLLEKGKRVEGKTLAGSGSFFTNMIHSYDAASAIVYAITHRLFGVYNLSDDEHPTRSELYQKICQHHHLSPPQWDPSTPSRSGNKRVSNHKLKSSGFVLRYPQRVFD